MAMASLVGRAAVGPRISARDEGGRGRPSARHADRWQTAASVRRRQVPRATEVGPASTKPRVVHIAAAKGQAAMTARAAGTTVVGMVRSMAGPTRWAPRYGAGANGARQGRR
jgi:hypothetical protein